MLKSRISQRIVGNKHPKQNAYTASPRLADGSIPILPVIIEASSDKISPKILFVTIVSNCKKF